MDQNSGKSLYVAINPLDGAGLILKIYCFNCWAWRLQWEKDGEFVWFNGGFPFCCLAVIGMALP